MPILFTDVYPVLEQAFKRHILNEYINNMIYVYEHEQELSNVDQIRRALHVLTC